MGGNASTSFTWNASQKDRAFILAAATEIFRVVVTNCDNSDTNDIEVTFEYTTDS